MAKFWILPTLRGLAYLAAANFIVRIILFLDKVMNSFFNYEMVLLYGAHLDTHILLFFQAVFMIPVAFLGVLVFYGVEKQSFNLVLYPTLMLMFLILLRYGAETALLIIHWEDHCLDRGPSLIFYSILDLTAIIVLLTYVYISLAAPPSPDSMPLTPSRLNSLRRRLQRLSSVKEGGDVEANGKKGSNAAPAAVTPTNIATTPKIVGVTKKKKKPPAPDPSPSGEGESLSLEEALTQIPPPRPPPSPKFNYKLRRNVSHLEKEEEKARLEELDKERSRNSKVLQEIEEKSETEEGGDSPTPTFTLKLKTQSLKVYEDEPKRRSLLIETDLDVENGTVVVKPDDNEEKVKEKVEEESQAAVEATQPEVVNPEEDDDEWEYEYEYEDEQAEKEKAGESSTGNENLQKDVKEENDVEKGDDENAPHEPETTTSSTGYKTTAV